MQRFVVAAARGGELGDELGRQRRGAGAGAARGRAASLASSAEAQPEPELGVVLEQRVAPRRAPTVGSGGVRGGGEVGAVDRRAAGRVGDHEVVAEELGERPDVGRLAASGAGPGELERGGQQRQGARMAGDGGAGQVGDLAEEVERLAFAVAMLGDRCHVDGLALGLGAVLGGTDLDAEPAAGAVVGRDLHGVGEAFELGGEPLGFAAERRAVRPRRAAGSNTLVTMAVWGQIIEQRLHCTHRSGSQIGISKAMARFSKRLVPVGQVPSGGNALTGSWSPWPSRMRRVTRCTKSGASAGTVGRAVGGAVAVAGTATSCSSASAASIASTLRRTISGPRRPHVACTDALIVVDRGPGGQHVGEREEAGLHDRVDPPAQPEAVGDRSNASITNRRQPLAMSASCTRRGSRSHAPSRVAGQVQQHGRTGRGPLEHVDAVEQPRVVHGHELGLADLVGRADRVGPEPQVRHGHRPGLLRVEHEVALALQRGGLADDLDRRLVAADRAVRAEAEEHRPPHLVGLGGRTSRRPAATGGSRRR